MITLTIAMAPLNEMMNTTFTCILPFPELPRTKHKNIRYHRVLQLLNVNLLLYHNTATSLATALIFSSMVLSPLNMTLLAMVLKCPRSQSSHSTQL